MPVASWKPSECFRPWDLYHWCVVTGIAARQHKRRLGANWWNMNNLYLFCIIINERDVKGTSELSQRTSKIGKATVETP